MSLPDVIREHARGEAPFFYALGIIPNSGDSWSTIRYATHDVNIDGDDYDAGIISDISRIAQTCNIIKGGGIASLGSVDITLLNIDKLHETFLTDRIIGRLATIKIGVIPPNRLLNPSFENHDSGTPTDFDDWTETVSAGGLIVYTTTAGYYVFDSTGVICIGGTSAETYFTQSDIEFKRGEPLCFSVYARGATGSETMKMAIAVMNDSGVYRYWNESTETWSSSRVWNDRSPSNAYERYDMRISPAVVECTDDDWSVRIEFGSDTGDTIYFDGAQLENAVGPTAFSVSKDELAATDVVSVFTGNIKSQKWNTDKITIAADERWNGHREIPVTILTENTDSGWTVPKDNLGKPFPMTYGDFSYYADNRYMWDYYTLGSSSAYLFQFARGILANADDAATSGVEVYFDRPDWDMYHWVSEFELLYHYDKKADRYFEQRHDDRTTPTHAAREILNTYYPTEARWVGIGSGRYWIKQKRCAWMAHLKGEYIESSTGITNPANAIDASRISYAYSTAESAVTLKYKIPQVETEHSICIDGGIYVLGKYLIAAGCYGGTGLIRVQLSGVTVSYSDSYVTICSSTGLEDSFDNLPMYESPDPRDAKETDVAINLSTRTNFIRKVTEDMFVEILLDGAACSSGYDGRIYETGVRIDFATDLLKTNFCCQMRGRGYQTDWGMRRTQYGLIEDAPDVVESILREEIGVPAADIDTAAFDTAVSENTIVIGGQLHDLTESLKVIEQICFESGLLYYMGGDGLHAIKHLGWKTPVDHITYNDTVSGSIKIDFTSLDDIANAIHIRYNKNQWSKEYALHSYCDRAGKSSTIAAGYDTKCSNNYADLGDVERFIELEFDWIKLPAAADTMVEWFVDWLAHQRMLVECLCFMDKLDRSIGDIVTLEFPNEIPASVSMSSRFVVMDRQINRRDGTIGFKLLEVVEP